MGPGFLNIKKVSSLKDIQSWLEKDREAPSVVDKEVEAILKDIRLKGDPAVLRMVKKFDGLEAKNIKDITISEDEKEKAYAKVKKNCPGLVQALKAGRRQIEEFHGEQFKKIARSWKIKPARGKEIGQHVSPIERIGIYIPGGRHIYPSSVLMTVIPARAAGVKEIIICTPPGPGGSLNDIFLYLGRWLKIDQVYKIGGAQAIGLMAFGTSSIKKVDKIVGPGNIYVTRAKKQVFGTVGIDSLAGPSDVTVLADSSADPAFIASDLLAQSDHDPDSRSTLLTSDPGTAKKVKEEMCRQYKKLASEHKDKIALDALLQSLKNNCRLIYSRDMRLLIDICNAIAPEHLEIMTKNTKEVMGKIKNAGAIFLGPYSPVAAGDYTGGTNHVIPTGGNARFDSPLGVYDFIKRSSTVSYSKEALKKEREHIENLAGFEGLYAHQDSVKIRFDR